MATGTSLVVETGMVTVVAEGERLATELVEGIKLETTSIELLETVGEFEGVWLIVTVLTLVLDAPWLKAMEGVWLDNTAELLEGVWLDNTAELLEGV